MSIRSVPGTPAPVPSTPKPAPAAIARPSAPVPRAPAGPALTPMLDTAQAVKLGALVNQPQNHVPTRALVPGVGPVALESAAAKTAIANTLSYLQGPGVGEGVASTSAIAANFSPNSVTRDDLGMTHVRLDRMHDGLKVFGEQIISHLDASGQVADVTGEAAGPALPAVDRQAVIGNTKAIQLASKDFGLTSETIPSSELLYVKASDGQYHAAYKVELTNLTEGPRPLKMNYFVDAMSGKVLKKYNQIDGITLPKKAQPAISSATHSVDVKAAIKDHAKVVSTIHLDEALDITKLQVKLDISHSNRGDLVVSLTSPSGKTAVISNHSGGSADDLKGTFGLAAFAGEPSKGDWKLTVEDTKRGHVGTLNSWGLDLKGTEPAPGPGPGPGPGPVSGGADDTTIYSGKVDLGAKEDTVNHDWFLEDDSRGKGVVTFDAKNQPKATGETQITDDNNVWGEGTDPERAKAGIDAQYGAEMTYDFYKNVLGRDSIDGSGEKLISYVHLNTKYDNAYWDGSQMQYGDGDGTQFGPLTSIDVAGHEISHGMTQKTAGLIYDGESGGLNEAMSDIMGKGVEWYASQNNPAVKFTWNIGEAIYTPGTPGDALRYMGDPTKDGYSIDNYKDYPKQTEVHGSSGIANNAFYLMAEGGKNKTSGGVVDAGVGMEKALKIMYRAETVYFTPSTTFAEAKAAAVKAATDLYGANSPEVKTTTQAWTAVGL